MSILLKNLFSITFYEKLSDVLVETIPMFDKQKFLKLIFCEDFENKELKERMRHTSNMLHHFFPADFSESIVLFELLIGKLRQRNFVDDSLVFMFLPDYVEIYGIDDYENSVIAIELITQFVSCEFAVRPFILRYQDKMIGQMTAWSLHQNYKVRRLASEGSRSRLPWAMALPALKNNPEPILELLDNMKNDPHEWVRRSVANSLNDITKDNPDVVLGIARKWKGISKVTDSVIKHGCRTLLKQGHTEILSFYGLESKNVDMTNFRVLTPQTKIGEDLCFSFSITSKQSQKQIIRLEYAIYYLRANNTLSKKVFMISEKTYLPNEAVSIHRKQSFKLITTRKFYAGQQQLSIIVNGVEKEIQNFELVNN